jgi:hypothetical protein
MANPFHNRGPNEFGLVHDMLEVSASDSTDNVGTGNIAVGLYIEVGGTVVFLNKDGNERTVVVPDNFYLTCSVSRVKSSGTTATGIHALVT